MIIFFADQDFNHTSFTTLFILYFKNKCVGKNFFAHNINMPILLSGLWGIRSVEMCTHELLEWKVELFLSLIFCKQKKIALACMVFPLSHS